MFKLHSSNEPKKWYSDFDEVRSIKDIEKNLLLLIQHYIVSTTIPSSDIRIAVLVHLYYIDLWREIKKYIRNIKNPFDLYVNLVDGSYPYDQLLKMKKKIEAHIPHSRVIISDNRGLDIGGTLSLINYIIEANLNYDLFLILHSKKSSQSVNKKFGNHWRQELLNSLLGTPRIASGIIELFQKNQSIGLVGSKIWHIKATDDRVFALGPNESIINEYVNIFNLKQSIDTLEFIGGTMFWIDADIILKKFKEVNLNAIRNDLEFGYFLNGQPTRTHAFERIFGLLVSNENKKIIVV